MPTRSLAVLLLLGLAACSAASDGDEPTEAVPVAAEPDAYWTLADVPELRLGATEDDVVEASFQDIRGVVRMRDHRIAVAEASILTVLVFGPDGAYLDGWGGAGGGPGEFYQLNDIALLPDGALLARDLQGQRITVFDADGTMRSESRIEDPLVRTFVGIDAAEHLLFWPEAVLPDEPGLSPATLLSVQAFELDGHSVGEVARARGTSMYRVVMNASSRATLTPPFAERALLHARGPFVVAAAQSPVVAFVDAVTGETRRYRMGLEPRPLTDADYEAFLERKAPIEDQEEPWLQVARDTRAAYAAMVDAIGLPEHLPYFDAALVDEDGNAWLQRYPAHDDTVTTWDVLAPNGRYVAQATMPRDLLRVYQIDHDAVTALTFGPYDEPIVVVYPIRR